MEIFFLFILLSIYLKIINFFLIKFKFCLDKQIESESHKSLLRNDELTPLSGTFYFLPIIIVLFHNFDLILIYVCSLFFFLGLMADLKIINSYKIRLFFQLLFLIALFLINKDIIINTRIVFIDELMKYTFAKILICTFFFMVLINGFNLIDGTNCLCSLNFLIIIFFIYLINKNLDIDFIQNEINILIVSSLIFVVFNFFGKNFLGDGAAYGISFLLGYILVKISLIDETISPYFIANLLWYPAFENLFSIIRRTISKKNNYLPDNNHLHQLIFKFIKNKNFIKKKYLKSSLIGMLINLILFINFTIGYYFLSNTIIQIILIISGLTFYLLAYYYLQKKNIY